MKWFQIIQLILGLASQILPIVRSAEEAVGAGNGEAKKTLVTDLVIAGVEAGNAAMVPIVKTILPAMIDTSVATLNATGAFQKTKK